MAPKDEDPRPDFRFREPEFERLNAKAFERPPLDGLAPRADEAPRSVDEILRQNLESDRAAGWYHVEPGDDRARRLRTRVYWATLAAVDIPLAVIAWTAGHGEPVAFVFSLSGMAFFTGRLTWETWFLRTDL